MLRQMIARVGAGTVALITVMGCNARDLVDVDPPTETVDSRQLKSAEGARLLYGAAIDAFAQAYAGAENTDKAYVPLTAIFTDELKSGSMTVGSAADQRVLSPTNDPNGEGGIVFRKLSKARLATGQAIEAFQKYGSTPQKPLLARMFALRGYTDVMFAEMFCSGVPLSNVDLDGNLTFGAASSTTEVLEHAVQMFDSALAYAGDSARYANLAKVGKGRALMNLNRYDDAVTAVNGVPDGFRYNVEFSGGGAGAINYFGLTTSRYFFAGQHVQIGGSEGGNGLPFSLASPDPGDAQRLFSTGFTNKYASTSSPIPLADGIEAQLIRAEVDLKNDNAAWLTKLNALRTTCLTTVGCLTPAPAGTGGIAGLPVLADPVTPASRINLVFKERAFWMFLTGHRLGDLRRLIRQYGRNAETVFPTGAYTLPNGIAGVAYGSAVVIPPDPAEVAKNPRYDGCLNLDA